MGKKKTSKKQDFCFEDMRIVKLKKGVKTYKYNPKAELLDKKFISGALWECIITNDVEAFKEILSIHLELTNKKNLAKETGISKRTLFRMLSPEGNPTLENVCKIVHWVCGNTASDSLTTEP